MHIYIYTYTYMYVYMHICMQVLQIVCSYIFRPCLAMSIPAGGCPVPALVWSLDSHSILLAPRSATPTGQVSATNGTGNVVIKLSEVYVCISASNRSVCMCIHIYIYTCVCIYGIYSTYKAYWHILHTHNLSIYSCWDSVN